MKPLLVTLLILPAIALSASSCSAQSRGGIDIKDTGLRRRYLQFNSAGNACYSRRNYRQAIVEYGKMVALAPQVMDGYFLRGMAYNRLNDYDHAIAEDTRAIQLDKIPPRRAATYYNRGMCYKAKGDFGHAVADITKSLQDGGDNTDAYEERGAAYAAQHNYKQAIADYTKAYRRDARHTLALSGRAQCYLALNDYQRAVADYDQFARAEAGHAESWGTLAWAQYLAGRIPDAIANNQKALRMNPRLTFVEFNLGLCYATQGNWASAQKEYRSVLGRGQTREVKMGLQDVRDALRKHPTTAALKQAETLLAKTAR